MQKDLPRGALWGKTAVLVHGFRGTHHGLERIATGLAKLGARVVVPDLPGFGLSAPICPSIFDAKQNLSPACAVCEYGMWFDAFLQCVDAKGLAAVVAHSFGCMVVGASKLLTAGIPSCRVFLLSPVLGMKVPFVRFCMVFVKAVYLLAQHLGERAGMLLLRSRAFADLVSLSMTKTKDKDLRKFIFAQHRLHFGEFANLENVCRVFEGSLLFDQYQAVLDLAKGSRVSVVCGDADALCPVREVMRLVRDSGQAGGAQGVNPTGGTATEGTECAITGTERAAAKQCGAEISHVVLPGMGHLVPYEGFRDVINYISVAI